MRILGLQCRQVGHWPRPLELELSARVSVVLGDNEAGKSTLRRALRALLFGPNPALVRPLSVAAFELIARVDYHGVQYCLHRKGRNLQQPLPEALQSLLDAGRAGRFADLFDLAHDNLSPREPAGFFAAEGAFGSVLFAARTGVSPLRLQLARKTLERRLADLDSAAKARDGIPLHATRYREAQARYEALARFEASDRRHEELEHHRAEVERLDGELKRLDEESRHLRRLVDGSADLEALQAAARELEALAARGPLPEPEQVAELRRLFEASAHCARLAEKAAAALHQAEVEDRRAEAPGQLHRFAPACEQLRKALAEYEAQRELVVDLDTRRAAQTEELRKLLSRLGAPSQTPPEETAAGLLRPEPERAWLRELLERDGQLRAELDRQSSLLDAAVRRLEALPGADTQPADTGTDRLDAALERLGVAVRLEQDIQRMRADQAEAATRLARLRGVLELADEAASPHGLPLPDPDAARAAEQALARARDEARALEQQRLQCESALTNRRRDLDALRQGLGSVASADDVRAARALRDQRLAGLAALVEQQDEATPARLAAGLDELTRLVRQADLLVDGRLEAGERLGRLKACEAQASQLDQDLAQLRAALAAANARVAEQQRELAAHWSFLRAPPKSSNEWFKAYQDWRADWDAAAQREAAIEQCLRELKAARDDALALAGAALPALAGLASAVAMQREVERERSKRLQQAARDEELRKQRDSAAVEVARVRGKLALVEAERAQWQAQWQQATAALPATLPRELASVSSWLGLQDDLRRLVGDMRKLAAETETRLRAVADLRAQIDQLLQQAADLEPTLDLAADLDPRAAFQRVDEACKASVDRLAHRDAVARELRRAQREHDEAQAALASARKELARAWQQAGLDGDCVEDRLATIEARSREASDLRQAIERHAASLRGRWGSDFEASAKELESQGVPALEARCNDVLAKLESVRAARDQAANRRRDVEAAIEAMRQGQEVVAVAQELADAREALFAKLDERLRLGAARLLLDAAYRKASDGGAEIEALASAFFATLTGHAYAGLRLELGEPGGPALLAVEPTRNEKTVDQLSVGTADQLWLALRLAGIVVAARETPFPLLLDDSLVQFDDLRLRAALSVLHQVSEHVQVVVFTHHEHLAALAEDTIPAADLRVQVLPTVDGSLRQRSSPTSDRPRRSRTTQPTAFDRLDTNDPSRTDGPVRAYRRRATRERDLAEAQRLVLDILAEADRPLSKSDILARAQERGADIEADWPIAIRALTEQQTVRQFGRRKGARYHLP